MAEQVTYKRAKTWHIALSQMTGIMQMAFYVLLGYAAYIGNLGYAITTVLVGVLITITRVFDSITDPFIALIGDQKEGRRAEDDHKGCTGVGIPGCGNGLGKIADQKNDDPGQQHSQPANCDSQSNGVDFHCFIFLSVLNVKGSHG